MPDLRSKISVPMSEGKSSAPNLKPILIGEPRDNPIAPVEQGHPGRDTPSFYGPCCSAQCCRRRQQGSCQTS